SVPGIISLTLMDYRIELPLQPLLLVSIVCVADFSLQVFLAITFVFRRELHGRIGVIAESTKSAARQLKLDQLILHLDCGHHHRISAADRNRKLLQPLSVHLGIERLFFLRIDVDALLAARHIDLQSHLFAFKKLAQVVIGLCARADAAHQEYCADRWLHSGNRPVRILPWTEKIAKGNRMASRERARWLILFQEPIQKRGTSPRAPNMVSSARL